MTREHNKVRTIRQTITRTFCTKNALVWKCDGKAIPDFEKPLFSNLLCLVVGTQIVSCPKKPDVLTVAQKEIHDFSQDAKGDADHIIFFSSFFVVGSFPVFVALLGSQMVWLRSFQKCFRQIYRRLMDGVGSCSFLQAITVVRFLFLFCNWRKGKDQLVHTLFWTTSHWHVVIPTDNPSPFKWEWYRYSLQTSICFVVFFFSPLKQSN